MRIPCILRWQRKECPVKIYTVHRHKLHFRKTILQIVLPIKRLAKPFYKSADYAGGKYI